MEIRIGVLHAQREVVIDTTLTLDEVHAAVNAALDSGSALRLSDEKGREVIMPAAHIAYIDIAAAESRRIGFGGVAS